MAFQRNPLIAADGSFSSAGATAWNSQIFGVSGADVGGIPYFPTATSETTSANLLYTETSGPRLQVGSGSGTSAGWQIGYHGVSGSSAIGGTTAGGIGGTNYALLSNANLTYIGGSGSSGVISFYPDGANTKGSISFVAGKGLAITAGTATTDVQALSVTQTWNAIGVPFIAKDTNITNSNSAAGSLIERWRVGGVTLNSISKAGNFDAVSYSVGGAAGANFGPGLPTSITVVNGLITAAS